MSDVSKTLFFIVNEDKKCFIVMYRPFESSNDVELYKLGDYVVVEKLNPISHAGQIDKITDNGIILRDLDEIRTAIPFNNIFSIKPLVDSMHDRACKLLFGTNKHPEFKYKDISEQVATKMSPERFQELLGELDGNSLQTLKEKNARYSTNGDSLHNFRSGAEVAGGTPAQACWGYMTKHLVALRDMVEKNDFSNRDDFLEKCQDTINYIRFLWCIGNEEIPPTNTEQKTCECKYESYDGSTCLLSGNFSPCSGYDSCTHYTPVK